VRFILRRFLRLWPGLAAATIVIAAASVFLTSMAAGDYLGAVRHFVARNLQLRIVYELPGVFAGGSGAAMAAVNGSWWTIPVEAKCYLYLALLGVVGLRRRWLSVLAFAVVAFLYLQSPTGQGLKYLYILFFATGLCARQFTAEVLRHRIAWSCAGLAAFLAAVASGRQDLATWVIVAPLVLLTGSMDTPGIRSAGRFGDLSYGIYIYAYFVQQLSVRYWPANGSLPGTLVVSVVATAALAWCSWHAVEAPALALKRRLRRWFPDRVA
jgi:peptidoglycan/LPS O-acetylase OafA/YrhL